jgi:molybdenum cofactor cytidylyltransferase
LFPWKGKPIIWHVAQTIDQMKFSQVVVVLGKDSKPVHAALNNFVFTFVENTLWNSGQASSIAEGVNALDKKIKAAFFFVGDQPLISCELINCVINSWKSQSGDIFVPHCGEQRGNPVLFSRKTFSKLLTLTGDQGGKRIFPEFNVTLVPWSRPEEFMDIDTQEDYQKLIEII